MNCVYKASLRWKFGSKSRSWVSKAQACRSRRGHGTQSLLLGLPPVGQALIEGLTGGVFTTSRPGADLEQPAQAPIVELAQPGPAAHAAARFVRAWTQARIGHGLPPARECPQAGTGQQQSQGNARADARDSSQPGIIGAALGLGVFPEAFFQVGYLLVPAGQLCFQGLGADRVGAGRVSQRVLVIAQSRALAGEQVEQGLALLQVREPLGRGLMQRWGKGLPELAQ